jgi:RNA polymerase sigma-70 factor (ECF subfamily)
MLFSSKDNNLVHKCLRNDRRAQKELFDRYYKAMFNTALRIVKDEETCYDVVQEAFILVFNNLEQFAFKSTIGAWIKTIVVRQAIHKIRPEVKAGTTIQNYDAIVWPEDLSGEYLQKAILELPDGYRTVFTMVEIEGYTHREVAEMMQISEGTSKSQLYQAKRMLQKKVSGL